MTSDKSWDPRFVSALRMVYAEAVGCSEPSARRDVDAWSIGALARADRLVTAETAGTVWAAIARAVAYQKTVRAPGRGVGWTRAEQRIAELIERGCPFKWDQWTRPTPAQAMRRVARIAARFGSPLLGLARWSVDHALEASAARRTEYSRAAEHMAGTPRYDYP